MENNQEGDKRLEKEELAQYNGNINIQALVILEVFMIKQKLEQLNSENSHIMAKL